MNLFGGSNFFAVIIVGGKTVFVCCFFALCAAMTVSIKNIGFFAVDEVERTLGSIVFENVVLYFTVGGIFPQTVSKHGESGYVVEFGYADKKGRSAGTAAVVECSRTAFCKFLTGFVFAGDEAQGTVSILLMVLMHAIGMGNGRTAGGCSQYPGITRFIVFSESKFRPGACGTGIFVVVQGAPVILIHLIDGECHTVLPHLACT